MKRTKVLYVEDETWNVALVQAIFQRVEGYEVYTGGTAGTGIESARKTRPDVILLDLKLPDMNGFEALKMLKADSELSRIPVLAVTADADREELQRNKEAGFWDTIVKPFTVNELLDAVANAAFSSPESNGPDNEE